MKQYYKITDLLVEMDTFGRTLEQAKPYLHPPVPSPDIIIKSQWSKLKNRFPFLSDDDGEYLATGSSFYRELINYDGFMLHSSAVVLNNKAYLFSADPGVGKSTHTQLWLNTFGSNAYILNDDKPALRLINNQWVAYGTPWSGKNNININTAVPLAGIAMIQRAEINEITPLTGSKAISEIYKQVSKSKNKDSQLKLLELLDSLMTNTPVWQLKCNMNPDAAILAHCVMSQIAK